MATLYITEIFPYLLPEEDVDRWPHRVAELRLGAHWIFAAFWVLAVCEAVCKEKLTFLIDLLVWGSGNFNLAILPLDSLGGIYGDLVLGHRTRKKAIAISLPLSLSFSISERKWRPFEAFPISIRGKEGPMELS